MTVCHVNDKVPGAVYIGRACNKHKASPFANPYRISSILSRFDVLMKYRAHLLTHPELVRRIPELRGKPLACWCRHEGQQRTKHNYCHGDILHEYLDDYTDDQLRSWGEAMNEQTTDAHAAEDVQALHDRIARLRRYIWAMWAEEDHPGNEALREEGKQAYQDVYANGDLDAPGEERDR